MRYQRVPIGRQRKGHCKLTLFKTTTSPVEAQWDYPYTAPGSSHAHATTMPGHRPYYLCQSVAYRGSKVSSRNYNGHGKKLDSVLCEKVPTETALPSPGNRGWLAPFQDHLMAQSLLSKTIWEKKWRKMSDSDIASPICFTNISNNLQWWHLQVQQLDGRHYNSH